jgi:hypothetical protein
MATLPVNIDATYEASPVDPSIKLHQTHHDMIHAAVNRQVSQGDLAFNLRDQPGVVGDGKADDTTALQAALDKSAAFGARAYANGTFKISDTLQISENADFSDAKFLYFGTGVAVKVGLRSGYSIRKSVRLPHVVAARKVANGWAAVAGSVGVLVQNCYNVDLTVPHIQNFATGLVIAGFGAGTSYCNVSLGHLDNNLRNLRFTADATGWANQNNFYGGRLSHNSNEGSVVSGSRHILIDTTANRVNNNSFWGSSLESPNVVEYHLDCGGNDNYWMNCRWENTGAGARVVWRANSIGNLIAQGFSSHTIVETREARTANALTTRARTRMVGDGGGGSSRSAVLSLENSASSAAAALRVMGAGAESSASEPGTDWAVEVSAQKLRGKRPTDRYERVGVDHVNGRVYVGPGSAAPTAYFGAVAGSMGFDGGSVSFGTDNTYDLGTAAHRPRYVRAATGVQTGAFAKAARPAAATAGVGTCIFDTTLKRPIWSTGSVWVDANGKAV